MGKVACSESFLISRGGEVSTFVVGGAAGVEEEAISEVVVILSLMLVVDDGLVFCRLAGGVLGGRVDMERRCGDVLFYGGGLDWVERVEGKERGVGIRSDARVFLLRESLLHCRVCTDLLLDNFNS